jgi:hypothetical protein
MPVAIVFTGDDDEEKKYCDSCDYLLIEKRDGSSICSNCSREYLPDSINKHKRKLGPSKSRYNDDGPILEPMTEYGQPRKKNETLPDKEERMMASKKSGFYWTDIQQWPPERQ